MSRNTSARESSTTFEVSICKLQPSCVFGLCAAGVLFPLSGFALQTAAVAPMEVRPLPAARQSLLPGP
eukprot:6061222-Amphidinium_carterae.1